MYAIVLLIVVALVSLLITRVATVALVATGMATESARFQARSALSGVGFTTGEAENVVDHPARRRIIMTLMLVGNVGLVTAIAALLGGFLAAERGTAVLRGASLVIGLGGVYLLARSSWVDARLKRAVTRVLDRTTELDVRDYAGLLQIQGGYAVRDIAVESGDWLEGRRLADLGLPDEGIIIIGVRRADGGYLGAPTADTVLEAGDVAVAYGHDEAFASLRRRRQGPEAEAEHRRSVEAQRRRDREEAAEREPRGSQHDP